MCACENGERCIYHAKMLIEHQAMWKRLCEIDNPDRRAGEGIVVPRHPPAQGDAERLIVPYRYL
jgi:hypothetical protein